MKARHKLLVLIAVLGTAAGLVYGCGASKPPASDVTPPPGESPCLDGQVRACHETVSIHEGVLTCRHGSQRCTNGTWGACGAVGSVEITSGHAGMLVPAGLDTDDGNLDPERRSCRRRGKKACRDGGVDAALPATDAAACDPCDPNCSAIYDDAGSLQLDAAAVPDAIISFTSVPPGQVDKLIQDKAGGQCPGPDASVAPGSPFGDECERWPSGDKDKAALLSACQGDTFCLAGERGDIGEMNKACCQKFRDGTTRGTYGVVGCVGPDITIGSICTLNGRDYFPICNRGSAPVAAGTNIYVAVTTGSVLPATYVFADAGLGFSPVGPVNCGPPVKCKTVDITRPSDCEPSINGNAECTFVVPDGGLAPGDCIPHTCAAPNDKISGTKKLYVNSRAPDGGPPGVAECISSDLLSLPQPPQPGCANNWTASPASSYTCPTRYAMRAEPVSYYVSCDPGYHVQWKNLVWLAATPANGSGTTSIVFEATTAPELPDGGIGPEYPTDGGLYWLGTAVNSPTSPTTQPASCQTTGPGPDCPRDLYQLLGGKPAATNEYLELTITMNPSPDGRLTPTLYSWALTYDCVSSE